MLGNKVLNVFLQFCFSLSISLTIIYFFYRESIVMTFASIIGIVICIYFMYIRFNKYKYLFIYIYILIFMFLLKTFWFQEVNSVSLNFVMMTIMSIGLSMYVIENEKSVNILKFIYFVLTLYVATYLLLGNTLRDISEVSTENFFSAMFLFLSILIVVANYYWSSKILIYPATLTLIVSFIALTRSSIIASLLLFLLLISIKFSYKFNKAQLITLFLAVITTILIFLSKIEDLIFNVLYRYGTRNSFIESQRLNIWKDYFSDFDIIKFTFGDGTGEHIYDGFTNLHNSYLMYHQTFGILILGIILLFVASMVYALYSKKYTYAILFTVLLVRIGFDEVMLVWAFDYVLITVILCIYLDKKKHTKLE